MCICATFRCQCQLVTCVNGLTSTIIHSPLTLLHAACFYRNGCKHATDQTGVIKEKTHCVWFCHTQCQTFPHRGATRCCSGAKCEQRWIGGVHDNPTEGHLFCTAHRSQIYAMGRFYSQSANGRKCRSPADNKTMCGKVHAIWAIDTRRGSSIQCCGRDTTRLHRPRHNIR